MRVGCHSSDECSCAWDTQSTGCCNPAAAGAAWFGQDTEDNILQNNLGKKGVQAFLNISIARTLPSELHAIQHSIPPCVLVCGSLCLHILAHKRASTAAAAGCTVYLAISLPPVVFPVRQVLDAWLPGRIDRHPFLRKAFLIFIITVGPHPCRAHR